MLVHTGTRQLKIIWNLIQENSKDNYEFSSAEKRALKHIDILNTSFTVRKSKRFCFLTDLLLQWNLSLIYYNPLAE